MPSRSPGGRLPHVILAAAGLGLAAALLAAALLAATQAPIPTASTARPARRPAIDAPPPGPPLVVARRVALAMEPGETLAAALARGGAAPAEARRAAAALAGDFDVVNPHPGQRLDLGLTGDGRLARLSLTTADERRVTETAGPGARLQVSDADAATTLADSRITGRVEGSLYLSLVDAGADPSLAAGVTRLFGRTVDLARDIESGDRFALILEQPRSADGAPAGAPSLLYAEVAGRGGPARLYRFQPPGGGPPTWFDGAVGPRRALLLATPVDGAHVTSTFGMRLHPILGYTRLHPGVDFGAAEGSPVLAAGDGVIEAARWAGGYGRWLKIRHAQGVETAYAHLSGWASGVAPGVAVHQGEVVGYVGATGLATGPHLHYEVFEAGRRVDPLAARSLTAVAANPAASAAFRAQKARIDALVEAG